MHHINRKKDKNHMVTSIDTEKLLTKSNTFAWLKNIFSKSETERNFPSLIDGIYELQ